MHPYYVIVNSGGNLTYQVGNLSIWPQGQWSMAENRILKFHDKQSAEDFMKLMKFSDNPLAWLYGSIEQRIHYNNDEDFKMGLMPMSNKDLINIVG